MWIDDEMTMPGLAMARSIGDRLAKRVGVIATPIVRKVSLDPASDPLIILASDGVWEFLESEVPPAPPPCSTIKPSRMRTTVASCYEVRHCLGGSTWRLVRDAPANSESRRVRMPRCPAQMAFKIFGAMPEHARVDATALCAKLIDRAAHRWREENGDGGSRDDITAMCIRATAMGSAHFAAVAGPSQ